MFFDCVLLLPQHKGQFGDAWLAATRGIKFLSREKIQGIDFIRLCASLEKFIISQSGSSKKRFSLRLSAILLSGVIRIFKEKTMLLQVEVFAVLQTIHLPPGISISFRRLSTELETPPTPKPKVRSKRPQKKPVVETPIQESVQLLDALAMEEPIVQIQDVLRPTVTSDMITIREEMGRRPEVLEEEYPLGILTERELEEIDSLLPRGPDVPAPSISKSPVSEPAPSLERIEVVAQIHASRGTFIETIERISTPSAQEPATQRKEAYLLEEQVAPTRKELTVELEVQQVPQVIEEVPAEEPPQISAPEEISVLREIQHEEILRRATEKARRSKKEQEQRVREVVMTKAISTEKDKLYISISKKTFVRINRCLENEGQYVDKECILPCRVKNIKVDSLYDKFWVFEGEDSVVARAGSSVRGSSIRESGGRRGLEPTVRKRSSLERELVIPSPRISSIPGDDRVRASGEPRQDSVEGRLTMEIEPIPLPTIEPMEVQFQVAEEAPQALPFIEQIGLPIVQAAARETVLEEPIPMEITVPEKSGVVSPVIEETMIDSRPKITWNMNYKERHQRIINIVASWDFNLRMLTVEDLCEKPFNKLVMAMAFSDLLILCAKKFIILNHQQDSLELLSVEKGPRFLK